MRGCTIAGISQTHTHTNPPPHRTQAQGLCAITKPACLCCCTTALRPPRHPRGAHLPPHRRLPACEAGMHLLLHDRPAADAPPQCPSSHLFPGRPAGPSSCPRGYTPKSRISSDSDHHGIFVLIFPPAGRLGPAAAPACRAPQPGDPGPKA